MKNLQEFYYNHVRGSYAAGCKKCVNNYNNCKYATDENFRKKISENSRRKYELNKEKKTQEELFFWK